MQNINCNENIDLRIILYILWKGKKIIMTTTGIFLFVALFFIIIRRPIYTSESMLQINPGAQSMPSMSSVLSGFGSDNSLIKSEVDIIKSREVAKRVVERLNSTNKISETDDAVTLQKKNSDQIDKITGNTKVIGNPGSYIVQIRYSSKNPQESALINNYIVEEYLAKKLEMRFESMKKVNEWLSQRVSELGEKLKNSQIAVSEFKQENKIFETDGKTIEEQKMSELNGELIAANTEKLKANARLENAMSLTKSGKIQSSSDVLNSQLIQRLKGEEADILRKKADLETKYGAKHPQIVNIKAELKDIESKIDNETNNITRSLQNEVKIAEIKENNIKEKIEALNIELTNVIKAKVKLDELERDVEANRALYESYLAKFKELSQGQESVQSNVQIISKAEVPLDPSYTGKKLIMLITLILGLFSGCGIVLILKYFDFGVSSVEEIEAITNTPVIGIVPEIVNSKEKIIDYCIKHPESKFSESIKSIITLLESFGSVQQNSVKTLLLTSSTLGEGKTTLAICLARMQASLNKKVLLIDADMRLSSLNHLIKGKSKHDLRTYLLGQSKMEDIIYNDKHGKIDYITSKDSEINSQDLLSSYRMKELLDNAKEKYDLVIIDSAPINLISDTFKLINNVDASLYVVRENKTKKCNLAYGFKQIGLHKSKISGIVMNFASAQNHEFNEQNQETIIEKYFNILSNKFNEKVGKLKSVINKINK